MPSNLDLDNRSTQNSTIIRSPRLETKATDLAMLAALATSSHMFWCNIGTSTNGIMPLLQNKLGDIDLSIAQRVKAWELLTRSGHVSRDLISGT